MIDGPDIWSTMVESDKDSSVRAELAPTGILRAAINLSNFLLVSDRSSSGDPIGVSPDMARAVADRLGVTYFIEYPEDIRLYGVSFNTQLGTSGWALQGEYSFRDDAPLQVDENELLAAALHFDLAGAPFASQLGAFGFGVVVPGFIERNISQVQMTATRVLSNIFKAEQIGFLLRPRRRLRYGFTIVCSTCAIPATATFSST